MAAESFDPIYQHILKSEGGLSDRNLKDDPGGRTMMGVTQGTYDSFRRSQGLGTQDVAKIGGGEHRTIFKSMYWDPIKGDNLPLGLDYALMDTAINAGPSRATRLLQRTLGLDEDGRMGNDTIMAIGNSNPAEILGQYTGNRRSWQLALPNAEANPGWKNRINDVNSLAANAIKNGGFGDRTFQVPVGQQAGNDSFGKGYNVSDGVFGASDGLIGNSGLVVETGDPFKFTTANAAGDVGPGSNNLGSATPIGPAPGGTSFSGADVSGGVASGSLNPALTPFAPAPGQFDFAQGTDVSGGTQPGTMNPGLVPGDTAFGGKFDAAQYLAANPDVARDAAFAQNPFNHYLQFGLKEGRAIDARGDRFDPSAYLSQNADVLKTGMDPLMHYAQYGAAEGRAAPIVGPDGTVQLAQNFAQGLTLGPQQASTIGPQQAGTVGPSGIFDAAAYLRNNPDVAAAHIDPTEHFLRNGAAEGRIIDDNGDRFDAKTYGAQNADVLAAGMDPLLHYVKYGAAEGRMAPIIGPDGAVRMVSNLGLTSPVASDLAGQLLAAPRTQAQVPPPAGLTIGAGPTAPTIGAGPAVQAFDGNAYLQANKDVAAAGYTPDTAIQHFLRFGQAEDRPLTLGGLHFDSQAYLAKNPDVASAGMNPIEHYLKFGQQEGRSAELIGPSGQAQEVQNWAPASVVGPDAWARLIGAPAATPTIGAPAATPTIGAGPAVQATSPSQNIGAYNFSNANVGGAMGATPQTFGSFYGPTASLNNLGLDVGPQASGTVSPYGFGGDVSGFNANGFGAAPSSGGATTGGVVGSLDSGLSGNAFLDSQINTLNAGNAALDAFNPAIRNGQFISATGNSDIFKAASDYNVATLGINQANLAKPAAPAAAPVSVPRVAQGAFAPAPFFGRW